MKTIAAYAYSMGARGQFGLESARKSLRQAALAVVLAGALGPLAYANTLPQEVRSALPLAQAAGQATLTFWGFDVYTARLWVAPGFDAGAYARHGFALELNYLRAFDSADIASRSLVEMRRQGSFDPATQARWEQQMRAVFPDVKAGDRITGVHQPGVAATFTLNGKPLGEVADPEFARVFFGIWLSPQTSEPAMRLALLAKASAPRP